MNNGKGLPRKKYLAKVKRLDEAGVNISPAGKMSKQDWLQWRKNLLKFSLPIVIAIFTMLSQGMTLQQVLPAVALLFYGACADYLNKKYQETIRLKH